MSGTGWDTQGVPEPVVLRRAATGDALAAANLWLRSRHAAIPGIPPPVHSDDEVRVHFASVTLKEHETWVAEANTKLVGLLVLKGEMDRSAIC